MRADQPLRAIRAFADLALWSMSSRFDEMYSQTGRPSIPSEKLLRAQLLRMLYSIRSERLLMEEIDYSVLFRWFVGMNMDEPVSAPHRNRHDNAPRLWAAALANDDDSQTIREVEGTGVC